MHLPSAVAALEALLQGILIGGLYAVTALGLSLVLGVLRIINLVHGELLILGAFLGYEWLEWTGIDPLVGLLVVVPCVAAFGFVLQRYLLSPLLSFGDEAPLLTTFGLSIIAQNIFILIFTGNSRLIERSYGVSGITLGPVTLSDIYLISFVIAVVLIGGVHLLVTRTSFGRQVRASAEDPVAAGIVGVNVQWIFAVTFALAAGCTAVGGVLAGTAFSFDPTSGTGYLLTGFAIVIIGGLGSIGGTLVGGVLVGVVESLGALMFGEGYLDFIGLVVLLVFLPLRPQGLFGMTRR